MAERLGKRWNPEQISRAVRGEFHDPAVAALVPETIYQAVLGDGASRTVAPMPAGPGGWWT